MTISQPCCTQSTERKAERPKPATCCRRPRTTRHFSQQDFKRLGASSCAALQQQQVVEHVFKTNKEGKHQTSALPLGLSRAWSTLVGVWYNTTQDFQRELTSAPDARARGYQPRRAHARRGEERERGPQVGASVRRGFVRGACFGDLFLIFSFWQLVEGASQIGLSARWGQLLLKFRIFRSFSRAKKLLSRLFLDLSRRKNCQCPVWYNVTLQPPWTLDAGCVHCAEYHQASNNSSSCSVLFLLSCLLSLAVWGAPRCGEKDAVLRLFSKIETTRKIYFEH